MCAQVIEPQQLMKIKKQRSKFIVDTGGCFGCTEVAGPLIFRDHLNIYPIEGPNDME
jgi:hypothetical protein